MIQQGPDSKEREKSPTLTPAPITVRRKGYWALDPKKVFDF